MKKSVVVYVEGNESSRSLVITAISFHMSRVAGGSYRGRHSCTNTSLPLSNSLYLLGLVFTDLVLPISCLMKRTCAFRALGETY